MTAALPVSAAAGDNVMVRLEPLPPKTILPTGKRIGLDELAETVRLEAAVSLSPTVKGMGTVLVSWLVIWSAMDVIVGGVLTGGITVTRKVRVTVLFTA